MIGSEFMRAQVWQYKDRDKFLGALERALALIDMALADKKWKGALSMLLGLRQETAKWYTAQHTGSVSVLYRAL